MSNQIAANAIDVTRLTDHFVIKLGVTDDRSRAFEDTTTILMPLSVAARMALIIFQEVRTSGGDITEFYTELSKSITKMNESPKKQGKRE